MDDLPQYCTARVLVLGCGNPLVGDDGFGPAVAELLLSEGVAGRGLGEENSGQKMAPAGAASPNIEQTANTPPNNSAPCPLPPAPSICVLNAGTGSRTILFNLVTGEHRPKGIIIVDALNAGKRPGELFEAPLESLSIEKAEDFNIHMTPASNMLLRLREMGVEIRILACQISKLPGRIQPGLSGDVAGAVGPAARRVLEIADEILKKG